MSDTKWVAGDWDSITVGQRVRLVNGDGAEAEFNAASGGSIWRLRSNVMTYFQSDWRLFVEATASPPLPTVPGIYADKGGEVWRFTDEDFPLESATYTMFCAPFTRLEPVAETAKEVLDRVEAWLFGRTEKRMGAEIIAGLREEFSA